jgi:hypothetical protein
VFASSGRARGRAIAPQVSLSTNVTATAARGLARTRPPGISVSNPNASITATTARVVAFARGPLVGVQSGVLVYVMLTDDLPYVTALADDMPYAMGLAADMPVLVSLSDND